MKAEKQKIGSLVTAQWVTSPRFHPIRSPMTLLNAFCLSFAHNAPIVPTVFISIQA